MRESIKGKNKNPGGKVRRWRREGRRREPLGSVTALLAAKEQKLGWGRMEGGGRKGWCE